MVRRSEHVTKIAKASPATPPIREKANDARKTIASSWELAPLSTTSGGEIALDPVDASSVGSDAATNDVHVDNRYVSKCHAILVPRVDGRHDVFDEGSTNGTFVNGVRLTKNVPRALDERDTIEFGTSSPNTRPSRFEYRRSLATDPTKAIREREREALARSYVDGVLGHRGILVL